MAARRRYWYQLQASKGEARLAVDLHNRSGDEPRLEAFIVHTVDCGRTRQIHVGETTQRTGRKAERLFAPRDSGHAYS